MIVVLDALAALTRSVPGLSGMSVSFLDSGEPMFSLHAETDVALLDISARLGCGTPELQHRDGSMWMSAYRNDPYIAIHGPHRKAEPVQHPDESVVRSAIDQVNVAIEGQR